MCGCLFAMNQVLCQIEVAELAKRFPQDSSIDSLVSSSSGVHCK